MTYWRGWSQAVSSSAFLYQGYVVSPGATECVVTARRDRARVPAPRAPVLAGAGEAVPPPPPPPAAPSAPSRLAVAGERALGRAPRAGEALLPGYTEVRTRGPLTQARAVRVVRVLAYVPMVVTLVVRAAAGLV